MFILEMDRYQNLSRPISVAIPFPLVPVNFGTGTTMSVFGAGTDFWFWYGHLVPVLVLELKNLSCVQKKVLINGLDLAE